MLLLFAFRHPVEEQVFFNVSVLCHELSNSCGQNSSNFEAEALAVETSLQHVGNLFTIAPAKCMDNVIFSDAKSVLQSLHGAKQLVYQKSSQNYRLIHQKPRRR